MKKTVLVVMFMCTSYVFSQDSKFTMVVYPSCSTALTCDSNRIGMHCTDSNTSTRYRCDGTTWIVLPSGGDMPKSTYDADANSIVDSAEKVDTDGDGTSEIKDSAGDVQFDARIGVGGAADSGFGFRLYQQGDDQGIKVCGFDDQSSACIRNYVSSVGEGKFSSTGGMKFEASGSIIMQTTAHLYQTLGDTAGAREWKLRDSTGVEVTTIDSDGNATLAAGKACVSASDGSYDIDCDGTADLSGPAMHIAAYATKGISGTVDRAHDATSAADASIARALDHGASGAPELAWSYQHHTLDRDIDGDGTADARMHVDGTTESLTGVADVRVRQGERDTDADGSADDEALFADDDGDGLYTPGEMWLIPRYQRVSTFYDCLGDTIPARWYAGNVSLNATFRDADPQSATSVIGACLIRNTAAGDSIVYGPMPWGATNGDALVVSKMREFRVRASPDVQSGQSCGRLLIGAVRTTTSFDATTKADGVFFWCDPESDVDGDGTVGDGNGDGDCADAGEDSDDCDWYAVVMDNATDNATLVGLASTTAINTGVVCEESTDGFRDFLIVGSQTKMRFYISPKGEFATADDLVATIYDNIPTAHSVHGWMAWSEWRSGSDSRLFLDYISYEGVR